MMTCVYNTSNACPLQTVQVVSALGSSTSVAGLTQVNWNGTHRLVVPSDNSLHKIYTFYIKATSKGNSVNYLGPYKLDVGCTSGMQITVNPQFYWNALNVPIGWTTELTTNIAYRFYPPTNNRTYCQLI